MHGGRSEQGHLRVGTDGKFRTLKGAGCGTQADQAVVGSGKQPAGRRRYGRRGDQSGRYKSRGPVEGAGTGAGSLRRLSRSRRRVYMARLPLTSWGQKSRGRSQ
jgi:hypothetical protein